MGIGQVEIIYKLICMAYNVHLCVLWQPIILDENLRSARSLATDENIRKDLTRFCRHVNEFIPKTRNWRNLADGQTWEKSSNLTNESVEAIVISLVCWLYAVAHVGQTLSRLLSLLHRVEVRVGLLKGLRTYSRPNETPKLSGRRCCETQTDSGRYRRIHGRRLCSNIRYIFWQNKFTNLSSEKTQKRQVFFGNNRPLLPPPFIRHWNDVRHVALRRVNWQRSIALVILGNV